MKILLLSGYDAESHKRWRKGLVANFPEHEWTELVLPARYFNWRIRGNSLSWAFGYRAELEQSYDLLIATSMVDLNGLRGFVPALAGVPSILYCHENQFAYPDDTSQKRHLEPKIVTLYSALTADKVIFNSKFNRDSFMEGAEQLLASMPDEVPVGLKEKLAAKSQVIPVPLEEPLFAEPLQRSKTEVISLLWNHRWEWDKGPERLLAAVEELIDRKLRFKLHVVGQQFRYQPKEFAQIKSAINCSSTAELGEWGYVEELDKYHQLLRDSDVVLSTALHDFQGLSVLEAVAFGCAPIVPDRLVYPEFFSEHYCYASTDDVTEVKHLADAVEKLITERQKNNELLVPDVSYLAWGKQKIRYSELINTTN